MNISVSVCVSVSVCESESECQCESECECLWLYSYFTTLRPKSTAKLPLPPSRLVDNVARATTRTGRPKNCAASYAKWA